MEMTPLDEEEVRAAISQGVKDAFSDPEVHAALIAGLAAAAGQKARKEAGNWLVETVKKFCLNAAWSVVWILVLWKLGGLPLVLTWLNGSKV